MSKARSRWTMAAALCVTFWMERGPAVAETRITWANEVGDNHHTLAPLNALGPPDAKATGIGVSGFVYVRFGKDVDKARPGLQPASPQAYDDLGAYLGQPLGEPEGKRLSDDELKQWDIIAFEINSQPGFKGWESSIWFITDMKHAAAGSFTEGKSASASSPLKYLAGSMSAASYVDYFKIHGLTGKLAKWATTGSVGWILIDVPSEIEIKPDKLFRIWASGAQIGEGSPDPDAIGFISH